VTTSRTSSCRSACPAELIVENVSLRDFRSYARLELGLGPGIVLAVGANGAGKTNLLEALHVVTQGFSPRTRTDAQLIRFGEAAARASVAGRRGDVATNVEVTLRAANAKIAVLNGALLPSAERLRGEITTLVFTPDRLGVLKGPPASRRAYVDRVLGRLSPARAQLPADYGAAVAQRNASLRRISAGLSSRAALDPWTEQVVELGAELVQARLETLASLEPPFAAHAEAFGLPRATLRYEGDPPTRESLAARADRDLERGVTGAGPHLDDVAISSAARPLRSFGSQGEQRLALLALLLAEAELLAERRRVPPLLLLDDVLSELDPARRRILVERVAGGGQTLITATDPAMLPGEPDQLVEVSPGTAR
jgi:DNA replication and repair protein RecF